MELPERLRDPGGQADSEEEVLRPQGYGGGMFMNMNQSIFGLIAAAGSQAGFAGRFEGQSSDEEEEEDADNSMARTVAGPRALDPGPHAAPSAALAQTTVLPEHARRSPKAGSRHRRKLSESRLARSVSGLSRFIRPSRVVSRPKTPPGEDAQPATAQDSPAPAPADVTPSIQITRTDTLTAPVMSRMLEARAQLAARPSFDSDRLSGEHSPGAGPGETGPTALAQKLKEIFQFERPEEVIEEYPCWLLQHVLLQGYMYITTRHIAFYAYLPKKAVSTGPPRFPRCRDAGLLTLAPDLKNEVAKSGYLSKCGRRNPKYNRYWFRLKGDVLSYYRDPQNLYFPSGHIDLRYGISASVTDKDKEGINFTVVTDQRTYYFRADSPQSANEWVKSLQRVIFRSHNDGDSVKISLPIENVIDVEETQMLDFAETCKIRVIDNDETYAIDEVSYFFFVPQHCFRFVHPSTERDVDGS